jgi:hypothetical protein
VADTEAELAALLRANEAETAETVDAGNGDEAGASE